MGYIMGYQKVIFGWLFDFFGTVGFFEKCTPRFTEECFALSIQSIPLSLGRSRSHLLQGVELI